jgi:hypothetical protein
MIFENQRGHALRDPNKKIRVGTHINVLESCIKQSSQKIQHIFEHGMGLASTSFFHNIPEIKSITSLEDDLNWQTCNDCNNKNGSNVEHKIITFSTENLLNSILNKHNWNLALVDGPHLQRVQIIEFLQNLQVEYIVEHDAEALSKFELETRCKISENNKYNIQQYVGLNPETIVYSKSMLLGNNLINILK